MKLNFIPENSDKIDLSLIKTDDKVKKQENDEQSELIKKILLSRNALFSNKTFFFS